MYIKQLACYNICIHNICTCKKGVTEMAIWTSRYSNKELSNNKQKYYCVGISLGKPKFPLGYALESQCYSLAPKGYMLNMEYEEYKEAYYQKLNDIGAMKIIDMVGKFELIAAMEGKELVFLCYEDIRNPEDWCHRTMFAQWYMEQTGEIIRELADPNPPKGKRKKESEAVKKVQSKDERSLSDQKEDSGFRQMSLFEMAGLTI